MWHWLCGVLFFLGGVGVLTCGTGLFLDDRFGCGALRISGGPPICLAQAGANAGMRRASAHGGAG